MHGACLNERVNLGQNVDLMLRLMIGAPFLLVMKSSLLDHSRRPWLL